MLLKEYEHKCKLLRIHWDKGETTQICDLIQHLMAGEEWSLALAPAVRKALLFDLAYCLRRHRIFLAAPLFAEVTADFMHTEYQVSRTLADQLIASTLCAVRSETTPPDLDAADQLNRDFLRYVFVASATASDDASLITDLGLGTGLISRIKVIAESLIAGTEPGSKATVTFEPILDDILREIMLEVSEELKVTPWIIDVYGLDYLLRVTSDEKALPVMSLPVSAVFQILLGIGREGTVTFGDLLTGWQKIPGLKAGQAATLEDQVKSFVQELTAYELIYEESRDPVTAKKTYRLTEITQRLTSDAFACKALRAGPGEFKRMPALYPIYQVALIRRIPDHMKQGFMEECRKSAASFAPKAIDVAMRSLARGMDHNELLEIFAPMLENAKTMNFAKIAIMRGFGSLHKAREIRKFLREKSKDPGLSEKLRETAKITLHSIESRPRKQTAIASDPFAAGASAV